MHALLGGKKRDRVEVYASLLAYGGDVENVKRNIARALERGYRHIKLHEKTTEAVAATRETTGPGIPIMVDVNCAWLPDAAHDAVMAMKPYDPLWVEEPIWPAEDVDALGRLRKATGVPLAAGENATGTLEFVRMAAAGHRLPAAERGEERHHGAMGDLPARRSRAARPACRIRPISARAISRRCTSSPPSRRRSRSSASSAISATCPMARACRSRTAAVQIPDMPGLGPDPDEELMRYRV